MEYHVPFVLNSYKKYLPKSVTILLEQPVLIDHWPTGFSSYDQWQHDR